MTIFGDTSPVPQLDAHTATETLLGWSNVSVVPLGIVFATAHTEAGAERQNPLFTASPCGLAVVTVTVCAATAIEEIETAASAHTGASSMARTRSSFFISRWCS